MTFRFERDYLADLEPVLARLGDVGYTGTLTEIETCKASGSTGGEILSCICSSLRKARRDGLDSATEAAVADYLSKAGPGH